jgi:very-short-patch-repair endonuclease
MGPYVLDFYCPAERIAVEVDGEIHGQPAQTRRDRVRDAWLNNRRVRVVRVSASDVLNDQALDAFVSMLIAVAAPSTAFGGPPPPLRGGGAKRVSSP